MPYAFELIRNRIDAPTPRPDPVGNAMKAAEVVSWLRSLKVSPKAFDSRRSSGQTSDALHRATAAVASKLRLDTKGVAEVAELVLDDANGYRGDDVLLHNEILGLKPRVGMPGK